MTYGWAIMIIILSISALFFFTKNQKLSIDVCILEPGMYCKAVSILPTGVILEVTNALGENIKNVQLPPLSSSIVTCITNSIKINLKDGETGRLYSLCYPVLKEDTKFISDLSIVYNKANSALQSSKKGSIKGRVKDTGDYIPHFALINLIYSDTSASGDPHMIITWVGEDDPSTTFKLIYSTDKDNLNNNFDAIPSGGYWRADMQSPSVSLVPNTKYYFKVVSTNSQTIAQSCLYCFKTCSIGVNGCGQGSCILSGTSSSFQCTS